MLRSMSGLLLAATLSAAYARDTAGVFDPSRLKGPAHGRPNEVMVLGSAHLSHLPKSFDPATLPDLRARLASWRPQIIAIEALSGPQCAFMRQYPDRYKDTIGSYCRDPAPARAATGLDVPAAVAEAERLLANWPANPTPAQRRRLAALFLASGERASALVQWLRLPQAERHAGDGIDAQLIALLDEQRTRHDESIQIAAVLAAELGLERVVAMDDHTADSADPHQKEAGEAITKAWKNPACTKFLKVNADLDAKFATAADMLSMYRGLNDPAMARLGFDCDFSSTLEEPSPEGYGRGYVGYWETRNLRMAANIREAIELAPPGSRTLVVVGAEHKWYLEAYLNQMHDVHIVDVAPLLRGSPAAGSPAAGSPAAGSPAG